MEMKREMTSEIKIDIFDKDGGLKKRWIKSKKNRLILFFDLWRDKRWYFSSKISHILSCRKREDFAYRIQILDKKCDDIRHNILHLSKKKKEKKNSSCL